MEILQRIVIKRQKYNSDKDFKGWNIKNEQNMGNC